MKLFKNKQEKRRDEFATLVGEFAEAHPKFKDSFMIFADPDTNVIVGAHRGLISGIHNKSDSRKIRDLFKYDASDDERNGQHSKRNLSIYQFLAEMDGMVDGFAKKLADLAQGKKDLVYLEKKGLVNFGTQTTDKVGNTREITVVKS